MKILSQKDIRWSGELIGKSQYTIWQYGCTLTCLSMLSDWYGQWETPSWLAETLSFTPEGKILWQSINGKLPFNFVYRYYQRDEKKLKDILFSKDNAALIEVNKCHWVVLIGFSRLNGFKIADPLDGTTKWLNKAKFANKVKYYISGFTEITRKK